MTEVNNLKLWDAVSKTDPSATKESTFGGRKQTSVNGYHMFKEATNIFGPIGIGWGFKIVEERWDDGALITVKINENENRYEQSKTHTMRILFWYLMDGVKGEFESIGHTAAIYKSSYGVSDDGEAPKKSLTDAIKKALSMLGFSADIFMGMYDNQDYVNQLKIESEIDKAEDRDAEVTAKRTETIEYIQNSIDSIKNSKSEIEVNGFAKVAIRYLEARKKIAAIADICEVGLKNVAIEGQKRKQEIKNEAA